MNKGIDIRIAKIVDAVEEAYACLDAAMRFADYFMQDKSEEERCELAVELPEAKEWIDIAMRNVEFLKKELEEQ